MSNRILLHLDEPDTIFPSDSTGNLTDLVVDAGTTAPSSVPSWTGRGRAFTQAGSTALIASDEVDASTVLLRDVTVQAILSMTLATAAGAMTVICRGVDDGSASEMVCWGLELQEQGAHAGYVEVRWFWEDPAGVVHTQPAGVFRHPGDGKLFLLTATRRWEATDRVVIRYYVNDEQIAELVTANGDIGGGTIGHTTLGGRKSGGGGGAWDRFFNGTIDELRVLNEEMSHDEVREDWRRMTVHQPAGVAMFVGLAPAGAPWYVNPANEIGRWCKIVGQSLGMGVAAIERLRAMHLPDRCDAAKAARWEHVCRLAVNPGDSLDVRRARIVAYLSREEGFALPILQALFAEVLDLDALDVEIMEFTNAIEDAFDTLEAERWIVGANGTWAIVAGELKVTQIAGADLRPIPSHATGYVRMPLEAGDGQLVVAAKLSTFWAALPLGVLAGLQLINRVTGDALWFGAYTDPADAIIKLGYFKRVAGVLSAFTVVVNPATHAAHWLRITRAKGAALGDFKLWWSTTGPSSGFATLDVATGLGELAWAGLAAIAEPGTAATAANLAATFDDWKVFCFNGLRTFLWYIFRDPMLPGDPDLVGAQGLIRKTKPSHTHAAVITSRSVLCDDPIDGRCDMGPMGGL